MILVMSGSAFLTPDQPAVLKLAEFAPAVGHGIVSRTVIAAPDARVVLFTFAAGQMLTEHTSASRALIQVLEGEGDFTFGGETRRLRAGELLHLPPEAPHAVHAVTEMVMLLTLISPRNGK